MKSEPTNDYEAGFEDGEAKLEKDNAQLRAALAAAEGREQALREALDEALVVGTYVSQEDVMVAMRLRKVLRPDAPPRQEGS